MRLFAAVFISMLIGGCSVFTPLQKSKFITINHLITTNKFNEAKGMIDDLVSDRRASNWPQTWFYKGLLIQSAHREGIRRNDRSLQELYPNQLFLAYEAYERALRLSRGRRFKNRIISQYVRLINDLQRYGTTSFNQGNFDLAQRSFEKALWLSESNILSLPLDTNLIYNAAIAAYENRNLASAISHLTRLDRMSHSVNASHLLFTVYMNNGDSLEARRVLTRNIEVFPESDELVLLLADFHLGQNNPSRAIEALEVALSRRGSVSFTLLNAKGLIYKNSSEYEKAIEVFEGMTEKFPDQLGPFTSIATCFYNIGVGIDEGSRTITNIIQFQAARERAIANYRRALLWLEKALIKNPNHTDNQLFADRLRRLVGSGGSNQ